MFGSIVVNVSRTIDRHADIIVDLDSVLKIRLNFNYIDKITFLTQNMPRFILAEIDATTDRTTNLDRVREGETQN
jgi:hypothetical protein